MAVGAASNFVLNIVELQNVITSASGVSPVTTLSNTVAQLQEMLIYDTKQLKVNTISAYGAPPIQVTDSINFAGGASVGGTTISGNGGGSFTTVSSIGNGDSRLAFTSTTTYGDVGIAMQVAGAVGTPLTVAVGGLTTLAGPLVLSGAGVPGLGKYLTCMDGVGTAEWQVPAMVSDARWKEGIRPLEEAGRVLEGIRGVRFHWKGYGVADVGVVAQEVAQVLPEAVIPGVGGLPDRVAYEKIIPVLVETVKELRGRVAELERVCGAAGCCIAASATAGR